MCVRKLALGLGLVGALGTSLASALGLGEIKLNSALNQPLDAEIKLLQVRDLSEEEILIKLASRDDFQRAGVEREYFLTDIRFKVVFDSANGAVVKLTTRKPVREPYLNFLLETQWPSGRLLREYTLLMDLPVFTDESVRPVSSAQTQPAPTTEPRVSPQPRTEPAARPAAPETETYSDTDTYADTQDSTAQDNSDYSPEPEGTLSSPASSVYGPVSADDTMWTIALKVRPDKSVTVQQTMLAIQRLNPDAFINDNINLLRKGQVLRIPNRDEIYGLSAQQAVVEVAQQNNDWSETSGIQLEGSRRIASEQREKSGGVGRVKLGAPSDVDDSEAGKGSGSVQGEVDALENELAITMEELDKSRRENSELKSRISELEEQIETMERLVDVSSQELRALQLASQQSADSDVDYSEASVTDTDEAESSDTGSADSAADADDQSVDSATSDALTGDLGTAADETESSAEQPAEAEQAQPETAEAVQPEPKPVTRRVIKAPPPEEGIVDLLMANILWIGGGLLAIIGAVVFFIRRRKEEQWEAPEDVVTNYDHITEEDLFPEIPDEDPQPHHDDSSVFNESELDLGVGHEEETALEEDDAPVESETGDVVGEADIYIAYGKFDQAEDMLQKVLTEEPARTDVRVKLLEVYTESKNLPKFDEHYGQLMSYGDESANQRAAELRSQFSNAAPYVAAAGVAAAGVAAGVAADDDFSLDLDAGAGNDLESGGELAADDFESDFADLDLELDLDIPDENESAQTDDDFGSIDLEFDSPAAETGSSETLAEEDDFSFDLDFDSADENSSATAQQPAANEFELELDSDDSSDGSLDFDLDASDDLTLEFNTDSDTAESAQQSTDLELDLSDDFSIESEADDSGTDGLQELDNLDTSDFDSLELEESGLELEGASDLDVSDLDDAGFAEDGVLDAGLGEDSLGEASLDDITLEEGVFDADDLDSVNLDDAVDFGELEADATLSEAAGDQADTDTSLDEIALDTSGNTETAPDVSLDEQADLDSDDFDFDSQDIDLAALDQEVEEMASDLDMSDAELDLALGTDTGESDLDDLAAELPEEDFDLDSLEEDLAALDADPAGAGAGLQMVQDSAPGASESEFDDEDAELDFLADADEAATKLDLARAYIDMGDNEGAKDILDEVTQEGTDVQRKEAEDLLTKIG